MPSIDERVVEMRFDNAQFERGIKESTSSLDKLKQALNFDKQSKNLQQLETNVNSVNFSGLQNGIQSISDRFSAMGIVGATVVSNLTTSVMNLGYKITSFIASPIRTAINLMNAGGKQRALNVAQAQFQIEGLKLSWKEISKDIDAAVTDTRYGFDEAALAASQLGASGIKAGDGLGKMRHSLLAISGVAAMTNAEYSDIANIFTTVASNGKLMTENIRSFAARGLNVTADLAKQFKVTESQMSKMISKGEISYKEFSEAMYNAYAKHAKEANRTFSGVTANIRAAFKRIGQEFWEPIVKNDSPIVKGLGEFKKLIGNTLKSAIHNNFVDDWTKFVNRIGKGMQKLFKDNHLMNAITNAVNTLGDAFSIFRTIVEPFKNIFQEIFPSKTTKDLDKFVGTIHKLVSEFKQFLSMDPDSVRSMSNWHILGSNSAIKDVESYKNIIANLLQIWDNAQPIFQGILSFIDIIKQAISGFFRAFSPVLEDILGYTAETTGVIANVGEYITKLATAARENDTFYKMFKKAYDLLLPVFRAFGKVVGFVITELDKFSVAITPIAHRILIFFQNFGNAVIPLFDTVEEEVEENTSLFGKFAKAVGKVLSVIGNISPIGILGKALEGIKYVLNLLTPAFNALKKIALDAFESIKKGLNFSNIVKAFEAGSFTALVIAIKDAFVKLKKTILAGKGYFYKPLNDIVNGVTTAIKSLTTAIKEETKSIQADRLIKLAKAILILAAAMFVISLIDPDRLLGAVFAMGAAFAELAAMMKFLSKLNNESMFSLDKGNGLFGSLKATFSKSMGSELIKTAAAVLILAGALKLIASIDAESLKRGIMAMGFLMAELALFSRYASRYDKESATSVKSKIPGKELIALAAALWVIAKVVKNLGEMDAEAMARGILGIGLILVELTAFAKYMNKYVGGKDSAKLSEGLITLSIAMAVLAKVVEKFGTMNPEDLARGLFGLGVALMEITLAMRSMPKIKGELAGALLAMSVGLIAIAFAVKMMSGIESESLASAIFGLAVALGAIVVALNFIKPETAAGAAGAIAAVCASMIMLALAMKILASIDPTSIAIALVSLAGALLIIGSAGALFGAAAPAMLMFGAAIALIGAGIGIAALGIAQLSVALIALVGALGLGADALIRFVIDAIDAILVAIPRIAQAVGIAIVELIGTVLNSLAEQIDELLPKIVSILSTLIDGLIVLVPKVVELVVTILQAVWDALVPALGGLWEWLKGFLGIAWEWIQEKVGGFFIWLVTSGRDAVVNFISGMFEKFGDLLDAIGQMIWGAIVKIGEFFVDMYNSGMEFIQNLINGFNDKVDAGIKAIDDFIYGLTETIGGYVQDFFKAGANLIQGLIDGVGSLWNDAVGAVGGLASSMWKKVTGFFGIKSPSREMYWVGEMFVAGLTNAINDFGANAVSATGDMAEGVYNSLADLPAQVQSILNDDLNPTITPVLDLSNIQNGTNSLNSLFGARTLSLATANGAQFDANRLAALNALEMNSKNSDVVAALGLLRGDVNALNDSFANTQVVLDSGALVGATAKQMDNALGRFNVYKGRGI